MPSKPLRFLYSKYANQAPVADNINDDKSYGAHTFSNGIKHLCTQGVDENFHQRNFKNLGRELTKMERINMLFTLSQSRFQSANGISSTGSASTHSRSGISRSGRNFSCSPSRNRSKSQEFQSKYKLVVTRSASDGKVEYSQSNCDNQQGLDTQNENEISENSQNITNSTPNKRNNESCNTEQNEKVMEITLQTRNSLRKSVLPAEGAASHFDLDTTPNNDARISSSRSSNNSFRTVELRHHNDRLRGNQSNRLLVNKLPRCNSGSPIDDDRLDSIHYQYLLNKDFTTPSMSTISSAKSDLVSSLFSARAHRPSTIRSNSTVHQQHIRENHFWNSNADPNNSLARDSTRTKSRHNSVATNKSPETQWPPRYSIIPSWPSYEDVQTLNSCTEHQYIMMQLYRKETRRGRDGRNMSATWKYQPTQKQVHVVPSHTTTECAMCNLYNQKIDPTMVPPNTPLVNCRDQQGFNSRMSNNYSIYANRGTPTSFSVATGPVVTPPSVLYNTKNGAISPSVSKEYSRWPSINEQNVSNSNISSPQTGAGRCMTTNHGNTKQNGRQSHPLPTKHVSFSGRSKTEMSFTWDAPKLAVIKANV